MGQTTSNENNIKKNVDILKRHRAKKIKKLLLKRNAQQNINNSTDMNETLDWFTDSTLNLSSENSLNGGSATSDNQNLDKINNFFKNQTKTDTSQNFSKYQNELSNLEKYIQQLGGYDALEGRILNISNSDFLKKIDSPYIGGSSILENISENSDDLDEINNELQLETEINNINNSDIEKVDNYVKQMGGYDLLNNRLLNITNNNLTKLDLFDSNSDVTISTIGFTDTIQSGGSIFQNKNYTKSTNSINSLTSSINNLQLGSYKNNTIQNGGDLSNTSYSNKLSELSHNANSENILNGGAKKKKSNKKKSIKLKRTIRNLSTTDSNSNELSTTDSSSSSQSNSNIISLSNTTSSNSNIPDKKDSDTVSTDDTARFAKVISKKINLSDSEKTVSSDVKRSSSSKISSSSSENKKKINNNIDSDLDKSSSSSEKDEELDEQSGGSELKAVPFYSSENSTDFYRSYQQKNRFN